MLRRSSLRVGSLLAAAAAFSGVAGLATTATAQLDGTVAEQIASPSAVIDRARLLADDGKLVHAYETLSSLLTASGADLTDTERATAMELSTSINRRIAALDAYEAFDPAHAHPQGVGPVAQHAGQIADFITGTGHRNIRQDFAIAVYRLLCFVAQFSDPGGDT